MNIQKQIQEAVMKSKEAIPLSQIPSDTAQLAAGGGLGDGNADDDKIDGGPDKVAVSQLKPAQKEVIVAKAVAFALGFAYNDYKGVGGSSGAPDLTDMEAIVSEDDYIMDGHHRWAAATLLKPDAQVNVIRINLPGPELITALNIMTKGKLGIQAGNKGRGDLANFSSEKIGKAIDRAIADGTKEGLQQWPYLTSEQVEEALGKVPGANGDSEKGRELMIQNSKKLNLQKMPGAPSRVDMPVIDAPKVDMIQKYLQKGTADVNEPFGSKLSAKMGDLKEVWQHRAGIIK